MAVLTRKELLHKVKELEEAARVDKINLDRLRQDRKDLEEDRDKERRDNYKEVYGNGYGDAKQNAIDLITSSIKAAKDKRDKCTMEGNEVGINNINSGILSFSTIKIKLMEDL